MAEPVGWLRAVVVDAADLPKLAEFWQAVLGVGVVESAPDWIQLKPDRSSTFLAFEQAPDGQAPTGFRTRPDIEVDGSRRGAGSHRGARRPTRRGDRGAAG